MRKRKFLTQTNNTKDIKVGTSNLVAREVWLEKKLKKIPKGKKILDAGAGELQYKKFCKHLKYVSQDFGQYDGEGNSAGLQMKTWDNSKLDIVSDIANMPLRSSSFDAIMCVEVFEHIPHPNEAVKEFSRLMKRGGKLIITTPVSSLTHFAPYYFYNGYSRYYFEKILPENGFKIKEISYNGNFFEYIAQELRRLEFVINKYTKLPSGLSAKERKARNIILKKLEEASSADAGSSDMLSLGIMVVAEKNDHN
jgi:ubiquinone/menaquinone biosynthesis C-methylase UbiE